MRALRAESAAHAVLRLNYLYLLVVLAVLAVWPSAPMARASGGSVPYILARGALFFLPPATVILLACEWALRRASVARTTVSFASAAAVLLMGTSGASGIAACFVRVAQGDRHAAATLRPGTPA
jgi:hypothetical protein